MPTQYTITVDTEEEWDWSSGWPTDNLSVSNIAALPRFDEACARHGAKVTYFTNYAVLKDPWASKILLEVSQRPGVEVGMHIHPWNTPPINSNEKVKARQTFLHNLPPDIICAKLTSVYEAFVALGLKPTSFRGGRYSSGGVIHEFLRDKGILADASVVPFTTWADDGAPDYRDRDLLPQRLPPRTTGDTPLWEIPLSFGYTRKPIHFWAGVFNKLERTPLRRLVGLASRSGLARKAWLNFENELGHNMLPFLQLLRSQQLPAVCFTLHSSSLMAGGNGYTPDESARERLFTYLDAILTEVAGWDDFQPATVTEVAQHLEQEWLDARAGNKSA